MKLENQLGSAFKTNKGHSKGRGICTIFHWLSRRNTEKHDSKIISEVEGLFFLNPKTDKEQQGIQGEIQTLNENTE